MPVQSEVRTEEFEADWQRLGFSAEELAALGKQGFVCCEQRGSNNRVFKLRFRLNGRPRVRYLGTDNEQAKSVQQRLTDLQQTTRDHRQLRRIEREARQLLAQAKTKLHPLLTVSGFDFHGLSIRRKRPQT